MKYTFIILLFFIKINIFAQKITAQTLDVSGGSHRANGYNIDYSIGQTATTTLKGSTYIITQGFQQPEAKQGVAVKENIVTFQAKIFPNPTQEQLNIEIQNTTESNVQLTIYNLTGQLLQSQQFNTNNYSIDVSNLPQGEYILTLQKENQRLVSKFVKL